MSGAKTPRVFKPDGFATRPRIVVHRTPHPTAVSHPVRIRSFRGIELSQNSPVRPELRKVQHRFGFGTNLAHIDGIAEYPPTALCPNDGAIPLHETLLGLHWRIPDADRGFWLLRHHCTKGVSRRYPERQHEKTWSCPRIGRSSASPMIACGLTP